jgi:hypothetical protein
VELATRKIQLGQCELSNLAEGSWQTGKVNLVKYLSMWSSISFTKCVMTSNCVSSLESPIEYQGELEVSTMGDLEGNIISPLIANFIIDGLEEKVTTRQHITMTNLKRMKWIKAKGHSSLFC